MFKKLALRMIPVLALLAMTSAGNAAGFVQSNTIPPPGGGATVTSITTSAPSGIKAGDDVIGFMVFLGSPAQISTITDGTNTYTVVDSLGPDSNGFTWATFAKTGASAAGATITINFGTAVSYPTAWFSEFNGYGVVDVHGLAKTAYGSGTNNIKSPSVTPTVANDLIVSFISDGGVNANAQPPVAGTTPAGLVAHMTDVTVGGWTVIQEDRTTTATTATSNSYSSNGSNTWALATVALKPAAVHPVSVNCTPNTLAVGNTSGTAVCAYTVNMSDNSTYSGTTTVAPAGLFSAVSGTGNSTAQINRTIVTSDIGMQNMTISPVQNGIGISPVPTFSVPVTPASVAGTPYAYGWKNVDPGAGNDGGVIVTMPAAGTVKEVAMRVVVPSTGGTSLVDIYKAGPNVPCASGTILHTGDLDATKAADTLQLPPLNGTPSLAIGDSICVVTQSGFQANGQATVTVTVQ